MTMYASLRPQDMVLRGVMRIIELVSLYFSSATAASAVDAEMRVCAPGLMSLPSNDIEVNVQGQTLRIDSSENPLHKILAINGRGTTVRHCRQRVVTGQVLYVVKFPGRKCRNRKGKSSNTSLTRSKGSNKYWIFSWIPFAPRVFLMIPMDDIRISLKVESAPRELSVLATRLLDGPITESCTYKFWNV
jgi:hypothetical protein